VLDNLAPVVEAAGRWYAVARRPLSAWFTAAAGIIGTREPGGSRRRAYQAGPPVPAHATIVAHARMCQWLTMPWSTKGSPRMSSSAASREVSTAIVLRGSSGRSRNTPAMRMVPASCNPRDRAMWAAMSGGCRVLRLGKRGVCGHHKDHEIDRLQGGRCHGVSLLLAQLAGRRGRARGACVLGWCFQQTPAP